jgi:hypothetical protein
VRRIGGPVEDLLDEWQEHIGRLRLFGETHQHQTPWVGLERFVGRLRQMPYEQVEHLMCQRRHIPLISPPWVNERSRVNSTATKHAVPPLQMTKHTATALPVCHAFHASLV